MESRKYVRKYGTERGDVREKRRNGEVMYQSMKIKRLRRKERNVEIIY